MVAHLIFARSRTTAQGKITVSLPVPNRRKLWVRINFLNPLAGLLLGISASVGAGEAETCADWLKTVAFAGHETEYSGEFIYQHDNAVETSRISHIIHAGTEYERIEGLDGPRREILRHDGQVWMSNEHGILQMGSQQARRRFPSLLPQQIDALRENYLAKLAGKERVAGYDTQVVLFSPKDRALYAHKIWIHSESGLLLKAAVLDDKNKVVEQYMFTQLKIGGKIDRSWLRPEVAHRIHGVKKVKQDDPAAMPVHSTSGWFAQFLPRGFKKITELERPMHDNHLPVTQIVYSDGLSAVSVFIEVNDHDEDDVDGWSTRGAMSLHHKVVGEHLHTVVGEVPPTVAAKILASIKHLRK
jgi:sigma-E factor negative regulatory protein RseB